MDTYFYLIMACLIGFEFWHSKQTGEQMGLPQVATNMSCSLMIVLLEPLTDQSYLPILQWCLDHALWSQSGHSLLIQIPLALILLDFMAYWLHRIQHHVPMLWSVHETHHQATEMNLSVGFRQSVFTFLVAWVVIVPHLFVGLSSQAIVIALFIHRLYDALMHTRMPISFGVFEMVFVSPRLHHVHHGYEARYVNKNFANVFILFDRLFGTYHEPSQQCIKVGLTKNKGPILNPFWAMIEPLIDLLKRKTLRSWLTFSKQ